MNIAIILLVMFLAVITAIYRVYHVFNIVLEISLYHSQLFKYLPSKKKLFWTAWNLNIDYWVNYVRTVDNYFKLNKKDHYGLG